MEIKIRTAKVEDAEKLLYIYSYYVKKTAVTFEYEVPSVEEFQERIRHISSHYPYLIAEEEGEIIGYSYADRLRPRAAFGWGCGDDNLSETGYTTKWFRTTYVYSYGRHPERAGRCKCCLIDYKADR